MAATEPVPSVSPTRILVVDDSEIMRRNLHVLLERHDAWKVCDEAENGREAIEKVERSQPDLVILDLQMPEMNGLDAARVISRLKPQTPILMVTMHMSPQLATEARKVGIRGTCSKVDIHCVVQAVEILLQHGTYFPN